MGKHCKVNKIWKIQSFYDELKRTSIVQIIYLCAWVTLMDMWIGILGYLMEFMEAMLKNRGIHKEECYWSFAWRKIYVCQIHGLSERKR